MVTILMGLLELMLEVLLLLMVRQHSLAMLVVWLRDVALGAERVGPWMRLACHHAGGWLPTAIGRLT